MLLFKLSQRQVTSPQRRLPGDVLVTWQHKNLVDQSDVSLGALVQSNRTIVACVIC